MARTRSALVIDDEALPRMLLSTSLHEAGYDVSEVSCGKDALQLMQENAFDIVLLDLVMPDTDGFQVLKQMKSDHRLADVPVVVVSGNEDMESVVRCLEMGAVDHLSKPFDPALLHTRFALQWRSANSKLRNSFIGQQLLRGRHGKRRKLIVRRRSVAST